MSVNYYANGRLAVLSSKLMSMDKYNRLAECETISMAVKVLGECGYDSMSTTNDYQKELSKELDNLLLLVGELSSDHYVTQYIMAKYDYHNAKVLAKSKYTRMDNIDYCYHVATLAPIVMQEYINNDDYKALPTNMRDALDKIDLLHLDGKDDPSTIDVLLDKAMYMDMVNFAHKSKYKVLRDVVAIDIDSTNLVLMYRMLSLGMTATQYKDMIVAGGTLDTQWLIDSYDNGDDDKRVFDMYYHHLRPLLELCIANKTNLMLVDSYANQLKRQAIQESNNIETISPLLVYFYNKQLEIDRIRYILMCVKSGLDKDTTMSRVKEIYGN